MELSHSEIKSLLTATGKKQEKLFKESNKVREENIGKNVYFRGIIEFSNICEKDCYYCGIRKSNTKIKRYRMKIEEIKACLEFIKKAGYGSVVLQSGELTTDSARQFLLDIMKLIHKEYPELGVTLSCGELDYDFLKKLREAGAHRYLLRVETSVPELYKKLHPKDHSLTKRKKVFEDLRKLDYQVGSGNMIGIPGQTLDDMITDLMFFKEMDFDMFGLGPYVIHKDTPLATPENIKWWNENKESIFNMTLNYLAILRIMMPTCNIATATALDVFDKQGRQKALGIGANVIMPSVTPNKYRGDYMLYQDKPCIDGHAHICAGCVVKKVTAVGLNPVLNEQGNSLHYINKVSKI